jgi:hypothetical protein
MADSAERAAVQLAELSNKYSEAQRNAQKAMSLFKDTRDENEVLKSNFEALKQASLRPPIEPLTSHAWPARSPAPPQNNPTPSPTRSHVVPPPSLLVAPAGTSAGLATELL